MGEQTHKLMIGSKVHYVDRTGLGHAVCRAAIVAELNPAAFTVALIDPEHGAMRFEYDVVFDHVSKTVGTVHWPECL